MEIQRLATCGHGLQRCRIRNVLYFSVNFVHESCVGERGGRCEHQLFVADHT